MDDIEEDRVQVDPDLPIDPDILQYAMEVDDRSTSEEDIAGAEESSKTARRRGSPEETLSDRDDPDFVASGISSQSDMEMSEDGDHGYGYDDDDNDDENQYLDEMGIPIPRRRRYRRPSPSRPRKPGAKRGPRKPLEPSPEFKQLHSEATLAFIDSDYDRAVTLVKQAISLNPEIFAAHALLSEIFLEQGFKDKALAALFSGAHTRARDPGVWVKVAQQIQEHGAEDEPSTLQDLIYCYSRVIDIDQKNYDARFQRAAANRKLGHYGKAAQEYERLLNELPHNPTALRNLAEVCMDLKDPDRALKRYEESISYYAALGLEGASDFGWSDVNIYTDLLADKNEFKRGILALRSLARWLLGRKRDEEWDVVEDDDREWDSEHSPRRTSTPWFVEGQYPLDSYGHGLPLELRVKLGLFRLKLDSGFKEEALYHFEWLEPDDISASGKHLDYGDLFREAADGLKDAGLPEEALRFYVPLQFSPEYGDTSLYMSMADCFAASQNDEEVENCYLTVAEYDSKNIDVRVRLAKFYETMNRPDEALKWITEAAELARAESTPSRRKGRHAYAARAGQLADELRLAESEGRTIHDGVQSRATQEPISFTRARGHAPRPAEERRTKSQESDDIKYLYTKFLELRPVMRAGEEDATEDWLDIAGALVGNFRANRVFYPMRKSLEFMGYSRAAQRKAGGLTRTTLLDEIENIAERLQTILGETNEFEETSIPTDYHSISFDEWLDVFLEYALVLSGQGHAEEAYDTLGLAADASVWCNSKPTVCQIYICWFTCAIRLNDEDTLTNVGRWFMKEYQFVTDTYRLFMTLSYMSGDGRKSLFHSAPSQKFILRQVKAVDLTIPVDLTDLRSQQRLPPTQFKGERPNLTNKDELGQPIPAQEMDVALLVLYGHILYTGSSFTNALNYFFRAYALDPENPVVLLSIALSYIHQSLKRQADNRHYMIMQGLSFMQEYRCVREQSHSLPQERQEMEFNFARVYHLLGLSHLAIQGYEKCLSIGEEIEVATAAATAKNPEQEQNREGGKAWAESFTQEAAYALQCLYAFSGDMEMAKRVTERWLVI